LSEDLSRLEQELNDLRQRVEGLEEQIKTQANLLTVLKGTRVSGPDQFVGDRRTYPVRPSGEGTRKPVGRKQGKGSAFSEQALAGTWFNRLGVVAILLALAFFLKWSFDNNLVGNLGRVIIGIVLGLAFLGAGEYFQHRKFAVYGQGFTGGGIAILYLSVFAAFQLYHLVNQPTAFALMILITLAASLLALRYDALAIGILGIVGGFATPFLLSNGSSNLFALFTYAAILDVGVFLVSYFKKWYMFNYLTFLFTFLIFTFWYVSEYSKAQMWLALLYLTIYFVIYLGVSFVRNVRMGEQTKPLDLVLIFANAAVYFALSYGVLETYYRDFMGFFSALLGLVYILIGNFTYKVNSKDPNLSLTFLGVAAGFITLAIPLQLADYWISIAWTIEAVILLWISFRFESFKTRLTGISIMLVGLLYLLGQPFRISGKEVVLFFNNAALAYLAVILLMIVAVYIFGRSKLDSRDKRLYTGLQITANLMIVILITREINAYFLYLSWANGYRAGYSTDARDLTLSVAWGLYASLLTVGGFLRKLSTLRLFGLGFLVVVILKVFLFDLSKLDTPYRILSFVILGVILLAISWLYQRYKHLIVGEEAQDDIS